MKAIGFLILIVMLVFMLVHYFMRYPETIVPFIILGLLILYLKRKLT